MKPSFDHKIREKAKAYRPEPKLQFEDLPQTTNKSHQYSLWKYVGGIAAAVAIILMASLFTPQIEQDVSLYAEVELIGDLEQSSTSLYDAYVLHDLYRSVN